MKYLRQFHRTLMFGIALASAVKSAGLPPSFEVRVEVQDSRGKEFAAQSKALCEEWYPKINAALFGRDYPLPFKEIKVIFEPSIWNGIWPNRTPVPAYTDGNAIHINSTYVADVHKDDPADYAGMLIHELAHVNQHYGNNRDAGWLVEGVADYVRHKYFEKNIEPRLELDAQGNLEGFELDRNKGTFATEGYLAGYTVTGSFLFWLEQRKDKDIVTELNKSLRAGRPEPGLFRQRCGAPPEALWREFVAQSRKAPGRV